MCEITLRVQQANSEEEGDSRVENCQAVGGASEPTAPHFCHHLKQKLFGANEFFL